MLGNPPYNAFAGVSPQEEQGLVEVYKRNLNAPVASGGWGIKKFNLDDFYVRFFRLAERRIVENQPVAREVVSFISNHSWISEPSFVVLRQHLLDSFDKFWVENLHGNRKISEYAPDGRTSETVFAIHGFSVGIQQGVATSLWVKTGKPRDGARRYPFKPMDVRYAYLDATIQPLFSRPSPELLMHSRLVGNRFLVTRDTADKTPEGPPFYAARLVCDYDSISGHARHFPALLCPDDHLFSDGKTRANLSNAARAYLADLGIAGADADHCVAGLIWMHALAIGYSPSYLAENADGIRLGWPRVPLPDSRKALEGSADLGQQVAILLDTEAKVSGVTAGKIDPLLRTIGVLSRVGGGTLDPDAGDLDVTASWGHAGKNGVTMPAKGRIIDREHDRAEREAMAASAEISGLPLDRALLLLGSATRDVYLNDVAYWKNVPANVWEYYIGGYQVIKKWLSYRENGLLGRGLRAEEAREVTDTTRRLAAIILMQPALDENYRRIKEAAFDWTRLG